MTREIKGLTDSEVERSYRLHGDNSLKKEKSKGFFGRFIENLSDPIIRILIFAVMLEVILTIGHINYFEIFGILAAIMISATVSTVSEYSSEKAFEKLDVSNNTQSVSVLRNSSIIKLDPRNIVIGDVVYLNSGEYVHADGVVISGRILVDQSALNGESREEAKYPSKGNDSSLSSSGNVFRGSVVTNGSAVMRVVRVGEETYYGKVAKDVQTETRVSPLKLRLTKLASDVSRIGYAIAVIVGLSYLFGAIVVDNSFNKDLIISAILDYRWLLATLLHALTLMITVVVVAAPEGLPMMITVVLSANMKRMLSDNVRVKKLVGIDTAGSLNILFTDKTGTLTCGLPVCDRIITEDGTYRTVSSLKKNKAVFEYLLLNAKYNTDVIESGDNFTGGNPTDRAIYAFFKDERVQQFTLKDKEPFRSETKYSSVLLENGIFLIKGAAELIIKMCDRCISQCGEHDFLSEKMYREYLSATEKSERVIAVATKNNASGQLCFVGLIVLKDSLRPGVRKAVEEVRGAGVQVVMITGDSKETAISIAGECGILGQVTEQSVIDGTMLRSLSDEELKSIIPKIRVVSRALPEDKTRLVRLAQELELVVGMTGDGINDSPSLKLADVGFSMGSGTDIAKEASDIVILDNSFSAIDKTILYGRTIFKSIRKFITFQLIMNLTACAISLIGQFIGIDTPITIIQMLWVNIIMDTLGALAFAGEAPHVYYMKEKPKRRTEPILTREMIINIVSNGCFTLGICLIFLLHPMFKLVLGFADSPDKFYTAFYALFIFAGLFNCLAARSERLWILSGISKNRLFVFIMLLITMIQLLMIYFGGSLFRCVPLAYSELISVIVMAFSVIPFDLVRRVFVKLK